MPKPSRAATFAASLLCAIGIATASAPLLAADAGITPTASATTMLAAVTAPLIAGDIGRFKAPAPDFSTDGAATADATTPGTLEDLVASKGDDETANDEDRCLATSVYYESKGEPLAGQLAVAQTIVNRTRSGRFPDSVCGVVKQQGQFSFVEKGTLPTPRADSSWQRAVAIAKIARDGLWKQIAPAALFFHARRVTPGWGKTRVAAVGNHVFFR